MSTLTTHGSRRLRERSGLPKRATETALTAALERGLWAQQTTGKLRRYLDKLGHHGSGAKPLIHANTVFIVGHKQALVTAWELPSWLRKDAQRQTEKAAPTLQPSKEAR